jgi:hypothetical protein
MSTAAVQLPHTKRFIYDEWPDCQGEIVEFRLVYRGRLPSEGKGDRKEKHQARKQFHQQLAALWKEHRYLSKALVGGLVQNDPRPEVDRIADEYARCGYRFVPLVNNRWNLACALDILFLRRDEPGGLVHWGGDIDNRIKVLFDSLRMPQECSELTESPQQGEDPFFCLLQDDSLITEVNITTDKLLVPIEANEHINDVLLIIKARTLVLDDGPFPLARFGW